MSKQSLGGHKNVVSIRPGVDERTTVRDFEEQLSSMESILKAFDGSQAADDHTARYLLREALRNTPIIAAEIPGSLKARLGSLYQALFELDQKYQDKAITQVLDENPALAAYLRDHGFGPENI